MAAYLYPTEPGWIEDMRDGWRESCLPYFSFSFLSFRPTTLPPPAFGSFWLYFYFTDTRTQDLNLKRKIQFRARVLECSDNGFSSQSDVFAYEFDGQPRIWFKCDALEEIRSVNCLLLSDADFAHVDNVNLLSSIRNSIAPVKRVSHAKVVQRTCHENLD